MPVKLPAISYARAVREAVRREGIWRFFAKIPRIYRSARRLGCGRFESLYVATMPGELARERSRRAWRNWDQEEIDREMQAWKDLAGR